MALALQTVALAGSAVDIKALRSAADAANVQAQLLGDIARRDVFGAQKDDASPVRIAP